MRRYTVAKSDQLNAEDLLAGPVVARIEDVRVKAPGADQPVQIRLSGGHQGWRPPKTVIRLLCAAWGPESSDWIGQWVRLYHEPSVRWAGEPVGGIRVSHLSGIDGPLAVALAETRGKRRLWRVLPLPEAEQRDGAPTADLVAVLREAGLSVADFDAARLAASKSTHAELTAEQRAAIAVWLAADPARLDALRPPTEERDDADDT